MSEATKEKLRVIAKAQWAASREKVEPDKKPNESLPAEERVVKVEVVCVNPRLVEVGGDGCARSLVDVGRNTNMAVGDEIVVSGHGEMLDVLQFVRMRDEELAVDHVGLPRDKRRVWRRM